MQERERERGSCVWDSAQFPGWDLDKNTQGRLNIVLSAHLAGDHICMSRPVAPGNPESLEGRGGDHSRKKSDIALFLLAGFLKSFA